MPPVDLCPTPFWVSLALTEDGQRRTSLPSPIRAGPASSLHPRHGERSIPDTDSLANHSEPAARAADHAPGEVRGQRVGLFGRRLEISNERQRDARPDAEKVGKSHGPDDTPRIDVENRSPRALHIACGVRATVTLDHHT